MRLRHGRLLARIDEAFVAANLRGVVLKGHVFARRFYPHPSARQTTDIDLMVDFDALDAARTALETLGYVMSETEKNDVALDEHHHWLLVHPHAAPVELHFHAYRGFGECLPSPPLIARAAPIEGHRALHVLDPSDELLFLCVHAAGHRFERLSWLYDIHLLVETLDAPATARALDRAAEFGFRRVVGYALSLVHDAFGDDVGPRSPGIVRTAIANATTRIPKTTVLRAATRFIYTTTLADSLSAAGRYARRSSLDHLRALL